MSHTEIAISKMGPAMAALPEDYQRFLLEYTSNGHNKTRAYLAVWPGGTYNAARGSATTVLRKPAVRAARKELAEEYLSSKEDIFEKIEQIGVDMDVADFEGAIRRGESLEQMREDGLDTRFVKTLVAKRYPNKDDPEEDYEIVRLELLDRQVALRDMGKAHSMFGEKRIHSLGPAQDDMSTPEGQIKALEAFEAETRGPQDER